MAEHDTFSLEHEEEYLINDEPVEAPKARKLLEYTETKFRKRTRCPYCRTQMRRAGAAESGGYVWSDVDIWICRNCGFWQAINDTLSYSESPANRTLSAHAAKIRSFTKPPEHCASQLALALRRNPEFWHKLHPTAFEKFVAEIFRANYHHVEVIHVGRPDDEGVDVLFIDASGEQWLIQVKRRENPSSSEGVGVLRNLLGAMFLKSVLKGIIVSTADHFTTRAYEKVDKAHELGRTIKLIDRGKLNRMLEPFIPSEPWLAALEADYVSNNVIDKLRAQLSQGN
jgi:hypothetical protein